MADPTHRHDEFHRGLVPTDQLGTGTASATTFLRGDQTYATPAAADDQTAAEVPFTPAGSISATDVQAAIEEVAAEATDDQTAAEVPFTPAGTIAATDVQAAIEEVSAEGLGVHSLDGAFHSDAADTNDLDATDAHHGLLPKLSGVSTEYLGGDGLWSSPSAADDQVASEVPFTPAGSLTSTDVQAALEEVAAEAAVVPPLADVLAAGNDAADIGIANPGIIQETEGVGSSTGDLLLQASAAGGFRVARIQAKANDALAGAFFDWYVTDDTGAIKARVRLDDDPTGGLALTSVRMVIGIDGDFGTPGQVLTPTEDGNVVWDTPAGAAGLPNNIEYLGDIPLGLPEL